MNTVELVYALKSRLYDNAINLYKDAYNKPVDGLDDYSEAIKTFQTLSEKEKEHVLFLIRTVIWDTMSDLFSWLDGNYLLTGQTDDAVLKINENKMNGNLQDIWVSIEEDMSKGDIEKFYLQ
ncbi:hypothetical protein [Bacteroides acidifaciens]|mgnify:FL=1|uniref:hypothetical protein n=1 Tax=Bacteroides acidifaciens TaxID=85831 RepID=UPI00248F8355|nr:hypothetical protein [Bacteroides acidifaciens]